MREKKKGQRGEKMSEECMYVQSRAKLRKTFIQLFSYYSKRNYRRVIYIINKAFSIFSVLSRSKIMNHC